MKAVFPMESPVLLPIVGSEMGFPVRRIYCVGKNYAAHAAEMGGAISQTAPFFFLKTPHDIIPSGMTVPYPVGTSNLHFEVELVVMLDKTLSQATESQAREAIFGYEVGIDLTKRDLQMQLKENAYPWALSKSFTHSAVISPIATAVQHSTRDEQRIVLRQNGTIRQEAKLGDMARTVEALLVYLSMLDTLHAGDILFTGTPAGVGAIHKGDSLHGSITNIGDVYLAYR